MSLSPAPIPRRPAVRSPPWPVAAAPDEADPGPAEAAPLCLHLPADTRHDDDWLFAFCQANRELRIERTAQGDLELMSPTGAETGMRNANLLVDFGLWARRDGRGIVFDSSTGFLLPNGAMRSPDVAWVLRSRLAALTAKEKRQFLPLAPDVVIELASPTDVPAALHVKMREWRDQGAGLGWLILPDAREVWRYGAGEEPAALEAPLELRDEERLPGLRLPLGEVWDTGFS